MVPTFWQYKTKRPFCCSIKKIIIWNNNQHYKIPENCDYISRAVWAEEAIVYSPLLELPSVFDPWHHKLPLVCLIRIILTRGKKLFLNIWLWSCNFLKKVKNKKKIKKIKNLTSFWWNFSTFRLHWFSHFSPFQELSLRPTPFITLKTLPLFIPGDNVLKVSW